MEPPPPMKGTRFQSSVESPAALLERVRKRLESSAAPGPARSPDAEFDLSRSDDLGPGWFDPEVQDGLAVRWTSRVFEFDAEVRSADHVLLECVLFPESGHRCLHARLWADGVPGGGCPIYPGSGRYFVALPAGTRGLARLTIDVGGSWCPHATGHSPDLRELGILVRRLALVVYLPELAPPARNMTLVAKVRRKLRRVLFGTDENERSAWLEARLSAVEESVRKAAAKEPEPFIALESVSTQIRGEIERRADLSRRD